MSRDAFDPDEIVFVGLIWLAFGSLFGAFLYDQGITEPPVSAIIGLLIVPAALALSYALGWVALRVLWAFETEVSDA